MLPGHCNKHGFKAFELLIVHLYLSLSKNKEHETVPV